MLPGVLTINGGSSSIKFAMYEQSAVPRRVWGGQVERVGKGDAYSQAARQLSATLQERLNDQRIAAIGHRIVHGGARLLEHQWITPEVMEELRRTLPLDMAHLPGEIALIETLERQFVGVSQVACFDTAFHRHLPRVAQLLPIPRRYDAKGVRRFGFHGLSYEYLMAELERIAGTAAAKGRVIFAHLGSGASMAAVREGKPVDATMAFTPTAGLMMGTRPGDLDPGLLVYLMRSENLSADAMDEFINRHCGLMGVSETSSDMRDLIARSLTDVRAAEAVELFAYQARKWIGALSTTLGGLDTLVFSGGIGERSPEVRERICLGLEFLGVRLDGSQNSRGADVISPVDAPVNVRVISTNEEIIIAQTVFRMLGLGDGKDAT